MIIERNLKLYSNGDIDNINYNILYSWEHRNLKTNYNLLTENSNLSKLNGSMWYWLLIVQPYLFIYCDWSKLNGYNWSELLLHQPQFAEHCDWDKLSSHQWSWLLRNRPQLKQYKK